LHEKLDQEFQGFAEDLQDELLAHAMPLQKFGPQLGRFTVDTLKGSKHPNMKEPRFDWDRGVWRVAFAFDPKRQAIVLAGGDKGGVDQKRFYQRLIATADRRFDEYLSALGPPGARRRKAQEKPHGKKS